MVLRDGLGIVFYKAQSIMILMTLLMKLRWVNYVKLRRIISACNSVEGWKKFCFMEEDGQKNLRWTLITLRPLLRL